MHNCCSPTPGLYHNGHFLGLSPVLFWVLGGVLGGRACKMMWTPSLSSASRSIHYSAILHLCQLFQLQYLREVVSPLFFLQRWFWTSCFLCNFRSPTDSNLKSYIWSSTCSFCCRGGSNIFPALYIPRQKSLCFLKYQFNFKMYFSANPNGGECLFWLLHKNDLTWKYTMMWWYTVY